MLLFPALNKKLGVRSSCFVGSENFGRSARFVGLSYGVSAFALLRIEDLTVFAHVVGSPMLQANTDAGLTTSTMKVVAMILGNMLPRTLYVNERFASGDHNRAAAASCSECHLTHS